MKLPLCVLLALSTLFASRSSAESGSRLVYMYLQRGKPGEVPNPIVDNLANLEQVTSAYWYKNGVRLISYHEGQTYPASRAEDGRFNISEEFDLVIHNVADTDGGVYTVKVAKNGQLLRGQVNVTVVASCKDILAPRHVYLERGHRGVIQNPHATKESNRWQITSAYWYKEEQLVISWFEGHTTLRPGAKSGQYNITREHFALVINNVSDTDEGKYVSRVVRNHQLSARRPVNVTVVVRPSEPIPWVEECGSSKDRNVCCRIELPADETEYTLNCHIGNARPAVDLHLVHVLANGSLEVVEQVVHIGTPGTEHFVVNTSLSFNGTFSGNITFRCLATGLAMGQNNGSTVEVHISKLSKEGRRRKDWHSTSPAFTVSPTTEVENKGTNRHAFHWIEATVIPSVAVSFFMVVVCVVVVVKRMRKRHSENKKSLAGDAVNVKANPSLQPLTTRPVMPGNQGHQEESIQGALLYETVVDIDTGT
ncbi:uncharacterized protein LOC110973855 [Acanthaster planci]|uniref:Uncharacterized protein LOC110973855 n=1 Tax=Acanthaster planci TaxID=133434 RepID=A0A8B7XL72_ACAPL|nr:uncharacterized protein LOC110973855 [Acanthaster planci]XP_022080706.1 uncharacterized protein LOC110973855 [Acanthaster planci]XP_022080707.1 uncharacterized protein LOC110973855 [Acanthaster planci]XP_022080708.1 uncharacterized protein LOC110973855 [Acanthaster planci]